MEIFLLKDNDCFGILFSLVRMLSIKSYITFRGIQNICPLPETKMNP